MSDILIKGMEMPKRGMVVNIYADGRVTNHFDEYGKTIGKAVPVPPHGRLIDADALLASENQHYEIHSDSYYVETRTIELAPTIIEADMDVMYYPQVDGITPTVIKGEEEEEE